MLRIFNSNMVFAIIVSGMGAFQHGYHSGIFTIDQTFLKNWIVSILNERDQQGSQDVNEINKAPYPGKGEDFLMRLAVSIYYVGGIVGACFIGRVGDRHGRRQGFWGGNIILISVSLLFFSFCQKAKSYEMFMVGRFIIGVNSGLDAGLCTMFLCEISPTKYRGAITAVYSAVISFAYLVSKILNTSQIMGNDTWWNLLPNVIAICPGLFQMFLLYFVKESPRYVLDKYGVDKCKDRLLWFRKADQYEIQDELTEMIKENNFLKRRINVKFLDLFRRKNFKRPLIICAVVVMGHQITGMKNLILFAGHLLENIGKDKAFVSIGLSLIDFFCTIGFLFLVETVGRKKLLLWGYGGMAASSGILFFTITLSDLDPALVYSTIFLAYVYVAFSALGPAPISWFITSEYFNQGSRHLAVTVIVSINLFMDLIMDVGFLYTGVNTTPYQIY